MKTTPTPHDALFKNFMTQPATACDLLEFHLPPELRQLCDLSTLRLESGSFIENNLRACYSDVLYSLKNDGGETVMFTLSLSIKAPLINICFSPDALRYCSHAEPSGGGVR